MARVLIIGAGGVGSVVAQKCAQQADVFESICLASRTRSRIEPIAKRIKQPVRVEQLDAGVPANTVKLIRDFKPDLVINVALPYQDLAIMDACLETSVHYLDTANYEPPDVAKFEYSWQWAYRERFEKRGIMAVLGCGFDPGVTNIFCAHAQEKLFDEIHYVDIVDCNAGSHGKAFATNFNPEINIREITQRGRYWENGEWKETDPLSVFEDIDYPGVGVKRSYLLYHEELESLVQNIRGLKRIRFWMTFSENYLTHLRVLENVGMTRIDPVMYEGREIVPLKFLKALLPDPGSLAENYTGKTSIGCIIEGVKDGKPKKVIVYNVCDHAECQREVGSQAISYTTGVPAVVGARMVLEGKWKGKGVFNVEQLPSQPFLEALGPAGLPWHVKDL